MDIDLLRRRYQRFIYQNFSWRERENCLEIFFFFKIEPDLYFSPQLRIMKPLPGQTVDLKKEIVDNFVFHLGLMEIPSYWKATCAPLISVECGRLDRIQISWWKDLILAGMGEFFFTNGIDFTSKDFLTLQSVASPSFPPFLAELDREKILIPISGGKDSAVVLQLLGKRKIGCFSLNPIPAVFKVVERGGGKNLIVVKRKIDERLLALNKKGYLNGHTPFSAYLAFLSVFCAVLFGFGQVAFGHERSANEGNLFFLGREINHQYSKSFIFEQKFASYLEKYLTPNLLVFSFLRPLYDFQISRIFSRYPQYFFSFRSCNRGQRRNIWCGSCPKCLSVFISLSPFLERETLIKIFGQDLFERPDLEPLLWALIGSKGHKPLECVGTIEEMQVSLYLSLKKAEKTNQPLPLLLRKFKTEILSRYPSLDKLSERLLASWDKRHNLPPDLEKILKEAYFQ